MMPFFDIEGGLPLAAARACAVAGLIAGFGGVLYPAAVTPRGLQRRTTERLRGLGYAGLAAGMGGLAIWLLAETADLAGDLDAGAVRSVLGATLFGHVILAQCALLALAAAAWRLWPAAAPVLAGGAVLLQAGHSHAYAMDGMGPLLAADAVHVLAAAGWFGCLVPLLVVVARETPAISALAARRFSVLAMGCVAAILLTAIEQGLVLFGGLPGILGTAYGWMALTKAGLLAGLLILAARNRFGHVPALTGVAPSLARRRFARTIGIEVALGAAVILAAGTLTELPPGMHTQPVWPFAWRPSLDAVREDPDFMAEALRGAAMMAGALLLLAAMLVSLMRWRKSWPAWSLRGGALAASGVLAFLALPHLDLLFVPAYPTQYFHSPTGFSVASVADGAALFPQNCASCHGGDGRGDGAAARTLPVPPANLTAAHLWMHQDGELFWWLAHGIQAPDGGQAMPGFAALLSDDQRWDLIDYIRAHNAGTSVGADGRWGRVVRAPGFAAQCALGETKQLADFAGQPVRLVLGKAGPVPGLVTIVTDAAEQPSAGLCVAADVQIAPAYQVAAGLDGNPMGAVFLIDPDGLLRRVWKPGAAPDADALMQAMMDISAHHADPALAAGAGMKMDGMKMGGMKM